MTDNIPEKLAGLAHEAVLMTQDLLTVHNQLIALGELEPTDLTRIYRRMGDISTGLHHLKDDVDQLLAGLFTIQWTENISEMREVVEHARET